MKRIGLIAVLFVTVIACSITPAGLTGGPVPTGTAQQIPQLAEATVSPSIPAPAFPANLVAWYPLTVDLNDVTGKNTPMQVKNASLEPGVGLVSNGLQTGDPAGSQIITPILSELNLDSFTMSIQFNVPDYWDRTNPVFTGGTQFRWLVYKLKPDGTIKLAYNNSQEVDCTLTYSLNSWHQAVFTYDGQTVVLYLDKVEGCRVTTALETGGIKNITQNDYSNGSTFYGTVRQLRVYNGVVAPAEIPFP